MMDDQYTKLYTCRLCGCAPEDIENISLFVSHFTIQHSCVESRSGRRTPYGHYITMSGQTPDAVATEWNKLMEVG